MKNLLYLLLLLSPTLRAQQSTIRGEVSILNSKYETKTRQYVANAQVEEDFDRATPQTTDPVGRFDLVAKGMKDQESITFSVKKEGLEVVNIDALSAVAGQNDLVKVYMATPKKIAEYKKQYYNIGKTSAERALEAKNKSLQAERQTLLADKNANKDRIAALETQLAFLEAQSAKIDGDARELARRYAPINLDDAAPFYRDAFAFFQQGDLTKALEVLQQANYRGLSKSILEERDSISKGYILLAQRDSVQTQRTQDALQGLLLQADLYKTAFAFDSTAACYGIMLKLDSTNLQVLRQYAFFLANQNQHKLAAYYYNKALLAAKTEETKAAILNRLGNAYRANTQMPEARDAYNAALMLFRKLSEKAPKEYDPSLALTLNSLGNYHKAAGDEQGIKQAIECFKEALEIYEKLDKTANGAYKPYRAITLNNLGRAYYGEKTWLRAKSAFEQSVKLYEELAEKNPDMLIPGDILEFVDLNLTNKDQDKSAYRFDRYSENLLNRALVVHRKMAEKNPDGFQPIIGITLNNLGNLYASHYREDKAESAYQEALALYRALADKNPKAFYPAVAQTLRNMSNFYQKIHKTVEAKSLSDEAAEIEKKQEKR